MVNKNLFLFFFTVLIISSFVSAVPPFQQNVNLDTGINIEFTEVDYLENSADHLFNAHVFNISNGLRMDNTTTVCNFHLFNDRGNHIINQQEMSYDSVGLDWEYNILGGNFTENGQYSYLIVCNATNIGGFVSVDIEVNQAGLELTTARVFLDVILLSIIIIFFLVSLFLMFHIEHYIAKFTLYWVSHLLLILITFIGWQYGVDGVLIGTAIIGVFRMLFLIITIAVFPMVLLSLAWIIYIHLFNEHMQKLIDKGEDPETAFALSKKKYGGWFSGK